MRLESSIATVVAIVSASGLLLAGPTAAQTQHVSPATQPAAIVHLLSQNEIDQLRDKPTKLSQHDIRVDGKTVGVQLVFGKYVGALTVVERGELAWAEYDQYVAEGAQPVAVVDGTQVYQWSGTGYTDFAFDRHVDAFIALQGVPEGRTLCYEVRLLWEADHGGR
jgi:hypothetical protein